MGSGNGDVNGDLTAREIREFTSSTRLRKSAAEAKKFRILDVFYLISHPPLFLHIIIKSANHASPRPRLHFDLSQGTARPPRAAVRHGSTRCRRITIGARSAAATRAPPRRVEGAGRGRTTSGRAHHRFRSSGGRRWPHSRQARRSRTRGRAIAHVRRKTPGIPDRPLPAQCCEWPCSSRCRDVRRRVSRAHRTSNRQLPAPWAALSLRGLVQIRGLGHRALRAFRRRRPDGADRATPDPPRPHAGTRRLKRNLISLYAKWVSPLRETTPVIRHAARRVSPVSPCPSIDSRRLNASTSPAEVKASPVRSRRRPHSAHAGFAAHDAISPKTAPNMMSSESPKVMGPEWNNARVSRIPARAV